MTKFRLSLFVATALHFQQAQALDLATYRSLYEFEPARVDQAAQSKPIDGRLAYEVAGSECAGYTIDSRFANRFNDGEQGTRTIDLQSSTYESSDGLQLEVTQKQLVNGETADDQRISVARDGVGATGNGEIKSSKPKTFSLAPDVFFPTAHQKKLLSLAQAGATHDVTNLYDGSDGEKQYRVVTFIGKRRPRGTYDADAKNPALNDLLTQDSWSFQLGYYSLDDTQAEDPEFQANFNMYENGVSTEMLFDYGSYAMRGKITRFEMTTPDKCEGVPPANSHAETTPQ